MTGSGKIIAHPFIVDVKEKILSTTYDPRTRISLDPTQPASYIVFQDEGMVKAKNGLTGEIEFSGTDFSSVVQQLINTVPYPPPNMGISIAIKEGKYYVSSPIIIERDAIEIKGAGFGSPFADDSRATVLLWSDRDIDFFVVQRGAGLPHGKRPTGVRLANMKLQGGAGKGSWGNGRAGVRVLGNADLFIMENLQITNFNAGAYILDADSPCVYGCSFQNNFAGLYVGTFAGYAKIMFCDVSDNTIDGIHIEGCVGAKIIGCVFARNNPAIRASSPVNTSIVGNTFFGQSGIYGAMYGWFRGATVTGNHFWNIASDKAVYLRDATYVTVADNVFWTDDARPASHFGIYEEFGTGPLGNNIFHGNVFYRYTAPINRVAATTVIRHNIGYPTENSGVATFSGDGTRTTFTIPHGLAGTPKSWRVEAGSADARGDKYVTADATNLYVTFATAPPAGTNNVVLVWQAEV
jgi:hypothetical protein